MEYLTARKFGFIRINARVRVRILVTYFFSFLFFFNEYREVLLATNSFRSFKNCNFNCNVTSSTMTD